VVVNDLFADSLSVTNIVPAATRISGDTIVWNAGTIPGGGTIRFRFEALVPVFMPRGTNPLPNTITVSAENETPDRMGNNSSALTVYNFVPEPAPFTPRIDAFPKVVDVTDSVQVRIQVPVPVTDWEIWVHWPDGSIDREFPSEEYKVTPLEPNKWYEIGEWYRYERMITSGDEEELVFELRARDRRGTEGVAQSQVTVRSNEDMVLDRNVYRPDMGEPIEISFKIAHAGIVELDVYDIAGRHITNLTEDHFAGGWNTYTWNGLVDNGQKVGSGVYLVTLKADDIKMYKKLILVR
jgi:hypothetical protein